MSNKSLFKKNLFIEEESAQKLTLFVQYSDYTVKEWDLLKRNLLKCGVQIQRIKNKTLAKKLAGTHYENISSSLHGSMAIITCKEDFSSKLLHDLLAAIGKDTKLFMVCAVLNGSIVFPGTLKKWSTLPSDDELYFQLTSLLNKPVLNLINTSQKGCMMLCSDLDRYLKSEDQ